MVETHTVTLELHPRDRSFRSNLGLLSMSGAVIRWRVHLVHSGGYAIPDVTNVKNSARAGFVIVETEQNTFRHRCRQIMLIVAVVQVQPIAQPEHEQQPN